MYCVNEKWIIKLLIAKFNNLENFFVVIVV